MSILTPVRHGAARAGGALLAGATKATATLRPAAKPLHPRGRIQQARLYRAGLQPPVGVEWLDTGGIDDVVVRESRAIGVPPPMPDIHGLAVRIPHAEGYGDLLFATTGWGRVTRFVLTPSRTTYGRPMTTLLPYRTAAGSVLLGARAVGEETVEIACSVRGGEWRHVADLRLSGIDVDESDPALDDDGDISFDPVLQRLPGLDQYGWIERLREPAYDEARTDRHES